MSSRSTKARNDGLFLPVLSIAWQIQRLDPLGCAPGFESEFETLMALFYDQLLDLDERLRKEDPVPPEAADRLRGLLRAGQEFDTLWDAYHAQQLEPTVLSRRLKNIRT